MLDWKITFNNECSKLNTVKLLLPYYTEINHLIAHKKFSELDEFISNIVVRNLSDVLLVGLLRLTTSIKENLPSWNKLLVDCSSELDAREFATEKVLCGLI